MTRQEAKNRFSFLYEDGFTKVDILILMDEIYDSLEAIIEVKEIIIKDKSAIMEAMAQPKTCKTCEYYIEQDLYFGSCVTLEYDVSSKWGCLSYEPKEQP